MKSTTDKNSKQNTTINSINNTSTSINSTTNKKEVSPNNISKNSNISINNTNNTNLQSKQTNNESSLNLNQPNITIKGEDLTFRSNSTTNDPVIIQQMNTQNIESALKQLQKELENLKSNQINKEEAIKQLNEKIKNYESENKSLMIQLQENFEKYNIEIQQRNEDLEFLKRAYDDQHNKMAREHEMISSSLYEMTLQFMTLKNEMNKKSPKKTPNTKTQGVKNFSLDK